MLFSSSTFLFLFLPAVLLGYYVLFRGMRREQNALLLVSSLFFYGWGEPRFLAVMLLSIVCNYLLGRWVHLCRLRGEELKTPVTVAVVGNLALLYVFKYLAFTVESLNFLGFGLPVPEITLPIGISFFTFQALSYVLDVAWGRTEVQRSLPDLGLYISFFPQLIAGPIVKYSTVAQEIQGRRETWADFSAGCSRFLVGLGKKVLLSNQMAVLVDQIFLIDPAQLSTPMAWLGAVAHCLQLYYDFSGYSDMAIGLGRMFGFHFLENFNYPFAARSMTDFWRRWHISLGSWFRDYVYIPLGGNRVDPEKRIRNLLIVWFLTGLWHGANWTYILWGLFSGLFLIAEKDLSLPQRVPAWLYRVFTLVSITILCMLFRSDTVGYAGQFLLTMLGLHGTGGTDALCSLYLRQNAVTLVLAALFSFPLAPALRERLDRFTTRYPALAPVSDVLSSLALLAVGLLSTAYLVKGTYNPFIYFRF